MLPPGVRGLTARKCLDGSLCSNFRNYFEVNGHHIRTRNNGLSLRLPKVKLSVAKQSFYFYGAKLYNSLPLSLRSTVDFKKFKELLHENFM